MQESFFLTMFTPKSSTYGDVKASIEIAGALILYHINLPNNFDEWYVWYIADGPHSCVITFTDNDAGYSIKVRANSAESIEHFASVFHCNYTEIKIIRPTVIKVICNPRPLGGMP